MERLRFTFIVQEAACALPEYSSSQDVSIVERLPVMARIIGSPENYASHGDACSGFLGLLVPSVDTSAQSGVAVFEVRV